MKKRGMKTSIYTTIAVAAIALTACNDNYISRKGDPVAASVTAGIEAPKTRAHDTSWDTDDRIGITATSSGATNFINVGYETAGGGGDFAPIGGAAAGIFFKDAATVNFTAYYPYNPAGGTISANTEDQSAQKSFDFLHASTTADISNPAVRFTGAGEFKHRMSRLVIKIKAADGQGFAADDIAGGTYKIGGIRHDGTFDTQSGIAAATGDATADWPISATPTDANGERTFNMILFPQDMSGAPATITATIGPQTFTNSTTVAPDMQAGKSYTYTITVRKTGIMVSGCTIEGWTEGGNETGNSELTFEGTAGPLTWVLKEDGTMTITGVGAIPDYYERSEQPWYMPSPGIITLIIGNGVTSIGTSAFDRCWCLTKVTLPDGLTKIGSGAFARCDDLTDIVIPEGVTEIGGGAFYSCSELKSIVIPDGVTKIEAYTFEGCEALDSVTIGAGVTNINGDSFGGCKNLTNVTCFGETPPTFDGPNSNFRVNTNDILRVPAASVEAYRASEEWNRSFATIEAIQ